MHLSDGFFRKLFQNMLFCIFGIISIYFNDRLAQLIPENIDSFNRKIADFGQYYFVVFIKLYFLYPIDFKMEPKHHVRLLSCSTQFEVAFSGV